MNNVELAVAFAHSLHALNRSPPLEQALRVNKLDLPKAASTLRSAARTPKKSATRRLAGTGHH
jgi:hypothetical protein